ncbi:MAG: tetratricopeptide repeat protein [Fimbriimonadaceae bacterium]|nr:tetratricopeptide repeat protein [Fimbriimonadaceae bacterium]
MDTQAPPTDNPHMMGDQCYSQGDYAAAVEAYRQAAEKNPANATAWKSLGLSFIALKQFDEAIEAGRKASELQPGNAEARYTYGYALGAAGRYNEAIRELDAALHLQPNNANAKQALIYSLVQVGMKALSDDPYDAEKAFDRAHKLDHKNPHVIAQLLELYLFMGQKGKAIQLVKGLTDNQKAESGIKAAIEKMEQNAEFKTALQQAAMQQHVTAQPPQAAKPAPVIQQIPCPNCKQMIMDYAAICPYCNFQNRQYGSFAGIKASTPSTTWQEVTYMILSVIWCLLSILNIILGFQIQVEGFKAFAVTIGVVNLGVGIGLLCRTESLMFIAKIFCYLNLLRCTLFMMIELFAGSPLWGVFHMVQLGMYGLMVYLINYEGG